MLDLLFIGCHSLPDETGRLHCALRERGLDAGGIRFVSSQDTRTVTELIEHRTAMRGYRVECLLHFVEDKARLDTLLSEGIEYVAMTTRYFRNVYELYDIVQYVRDSNPSVNIIVGGGFLRSAASKLEPWERQRLLSLIQADYYLFHDDCAHLVRSIVEAQGNVRRLEQIPHLVWKEPSGAYRTSAARDQSRISVDVPLMWEESSELIPEITSLKTTVSCPFSCSFCAVKNQTEPFRTLPLEVIRQNIERLMRLGRTKILHFTDETINLPRARFHEFLHMLIELNSGFSWYSFCRCEQMDEETAVLMKRSGCMAVLLGLESGSDRLLQGMNKQVTTERLRQTHRLYQRAGIATIGFFIVGFPGETRDTVEETVRFIEEIQPDFYRLHAWECEVGTAVWERRRSLGLRLSNGVWSHSTMDLPAARQHMERMQTQITHSVSIAQADFSFALQLMHHGFSLERVKELFRQLNTADRKSNKSCAGRSL